MEPVDSKPDIFRENTIDRLYTVHPNLDECFFLCMLLVNVPGPRSFQQLKIVDGITHATFCTACHALNLLEIAKLNLYKTYALFCCSSLIHATTLYHSAAWQVNPSVYIYVAKFYCNNGAYSLHCLEKTFCYKSFAYLN